MKEIIKLFHVKRQMKRKITNLCMLVISPRIYQNHDVSPVPVSADYFTRTVGLQRANGVGGLWGCRGWKTWKKFIAALRPNWLFSVSSLVFFSNNPLLFFFFLFVAAASCLSQLPTGLFSFFPRATFFLYSSQTLCEMRGFRLPAWNRCGSVHQPIKSRRRHSEPHRSKRQSESKHRKHKQSIPRKIVKLTWCSMVSASLKS